jgi:hypothetical protein
VLGKKKSNCFAINRHYRFSFSIRRTEHILIKIFDYTQPFWLQGSLTRVRKGRELKNTHLADSTSQSLNLWQQTPLISALTIGHNSQSILFTFHSCNVRHILIWVIPWLKPLFTGFSPRRQRFGSSVVHVEFIVGEMLLGEVFLRKFWFSPNQLLFHQCSTFMFHQDWFNRPTWVCSVKKLNSTPLLQPELHSNVMLSTASLPSSGCFSKWCTHYLPFLRPSGNYLENIKYCITYLVILIDANYKYLKKLNSVALVSEQTIPTERLPLAGEASANFCR